MQIWKSYEYYYGQTCQILHIECARHTFQVILMLTCTEARISHIPLGCVDQLMCASIVHSYSTITDEPEKITPCQD